MEQGGAVRVPQGQPSRDICRREGSGQCCCGTLSGALRPERPSRTPTYVNAPASASPKQQLHYLGLELPEAGAGVRGASTSCYAQIDLEATAAAHRAGARHAQAREERLAELEPRRKGAPR